MSENSDFSKKLIEAIENSELKLPTQPEVAVRIRECAEDPNVNADKLAKVIAHDPALSARFIQIANSPLMRGAESIQSLPNVVSRLGVKFVADVAIGLAMEQIFQATDETIDKMMREVWSSSSYVAAHAHVYAKHFAKVPSETASLAGLLHQIGILPILSYAQDHDELLNDHKELLRLIKENHPKIGEHILTSWNFPKEISHVPTKIYDSKEEACVPPNLINVVQASVLRTNQLNKNFVNIDDLQVDMKELLHLDNEEALLQDQLSQDLDESMRFYCKL